MFSTTVLRKVRDIRSRHEPVLGTVLDLRLTGRGRRTLRSAESVLLAEIDRLEQIFSIYRPTSDLSRWRADPDPGAQPPGEVVQLLRQAEFWQSASGGAFNPAAGEAQRLWAEAESTATVPDDARLDDLAAAIAKPRFRVHAGTGAAARVEKLGDCRDLTFHAIAKGFVIDLALTHLLRTTGVTSAMINIGGDLVHAGGGTVGVGIEDPASTADNAAPVERVVISNAALATSSGTRRGFRIGDTWLGHVIDPRTARPVPAIAGASVIAPTASTADVLATIVGVLPPAEGIAFIDGLGETHRPVACRITDATGAVLRSETWSAYV